MPHNEPMLDPSFKFSQHSLSEYVECPRRFYLHYVARLAWPTVERNPLDLPPLDYQRYLQRGLELHRRIQRHWLGVPAPAVPAPADGPTDEELALWWDRFRRTDFGDLPPRREPELGLCAPVGDHLLYARFDLLAHGGGALDPRDPRAVIVDWKTLRGAQRWTARRFAERIQTRVYLYVLAAAGAPLNGGQPFAPERCSMRYWLANYPERPWVEVPYSTADYRRDEAWLLGLIGQACRGESEDDYARGDGGRRCACCTYLTLCQRAGVALGAGASADGEDDFYDVDSAAEADTAEIDY